MEYTAAYETYHHDVEGWPTVEQKVI